MAAQKKAVIIATSHGVETGEILKPKDFLEKKGVSVTIATPANETIQTLVMDKDAGPSVESDVELATINAADFDILIVPGGTINADALRLDAEAKRIVTEFSSAGKPIAAICHAPWMTVETDIAVGKTLTSFPSLRRDVNNAGGNWVDEPVVVDDTNGYVLITSRTPDDMTEFTAAIESQLA